MAPRARPERRCNHDPGSARSHERPLQLHRRFRLRSSGGCGSGAHLVPARAGRVRDRTPAAVSTRHGVVLFEHQLRPPRARSRGGERHDPRAAATRADLPAAGPRGDVVSLRNIDRRRIRARLRRPGDSAGPAGNVARRRGDALARCSPFAFRGVVHDPAIVLYPLRSVRGVAAACFAASPLKRGVHRGRGCRLSGGRRRRIRGCRRRAASCRSYRREPRARAPLHRGARAIRSWLPTTASWWRCRRA